METVRKEKGKLYEKEKFEDGSNRGIEGLSKKKERKRGWKEFPISIEGCEKNSALLFHTF